MTTERLTVTGIKKATQKSVSSPSRLRQGHIRRLEEAESSPVTGPFIAGGTWTNKRYQTESQRPNSPLEPPRIGGEREAGSPRCRGGGDPPGKGRGQRVVRKSLCYFLDVHTVFFSLSITILDKKGYGSPVVTFTKGQPLGFLSSWPLFTLTHHMLVWIAAVRGCMARRSFATMPFLATVIANEKVAAAYQDLSNECTITQSKSLIENQGALEFAKRLWSDEVTRDFSPVSA
ncbi:hypothetical protein Scep_031080 [Stephania cephalantha]|uniref:Uncharacterized protein n=1 Tax=Stephania cephalantha TaxID=152367 RepID=A0AAP0HFL7_9MAGN